MNVGLELQALAWGAALSSAWLPGPILFYREEMFYIFSQELPWVFTAPHHPGRQLEWSELE